MVMITFFLSFCISAIYEPPHLDDLNFEKKMKTYPLAFVFLNQINNTFCEEVLPKFRAAGELFKAKCQFIVLDVEKSPLTIEAYNFTYFPSLFIFRKGKLMAEYTDIRNTTHIVKYLRRITADPVINLETDVKAFDFINSNPVSVVLGGDSEIDESIVESFKSVAKELFDLVPFVFASTSDAYGQFGFESTPAIRIHRLADDTIIPFEFTDSVDTDKFKQFVLENIKPKYRSKDGILFREFVNDPRFSLICLLDPTHRSSMKLLHSNMKSVIELYGDRFTYGYAPIKDMVPLAIQMGFSSTKEPVWGYVNFSETGDVSQKFIIPEGTDVTSELLLRFTENFAKQYFQPIIRSEEDENEGPGPLKRLVGSTFNKVVSNPIDDILLLLTIGKDEDVKTAMTSVNLVAHEFQKQKVDTVLFYYLNYELNDLQGLERIDLKKPALIYWPAGKARKPMMLPDDFDPSNIMKIIKSQSKLNLKIKIPSKFDSGSLEL